MGIKDLSEQIAQYLADYSNKNFTGKITFQFNFREGGVANTNVQINEDFNNFQKNLTSKDTKGNLNIR